MFISTEKQDRLSTLREEPRNKAPTPNAEGFWNLSQTRWQSLNGSSFIRSRIEL